MVMHEGIMQEDGHHLHCPVRYLEKRIDLFCLLYICHVGNPLLATWLRLLCSSLSSLAGLETCPQVSKT